jgi:hypothetical protein
MSHWDQLNSGLHANFATSQKSHPYYRLFKREKTEGLFSVMTVPKTACLCWLKKRTQSYMYVRMTDAMYR